MVEIRKGYKMPHMNPEHWLHEVEFEAWSRAVATAHSAACASSRDPATDDGLDKICLGAWRSVLHKIQKMRGSCGCKSPGHPCLDLVNTDELIAELQETRFEYAREFLLVVTETLNATVAAAFAQDRAA